MEAAVDGEVWHRGIHETANRGGPIERKARIVHTGQNLGIPMKTKNHFKQETIASVRNMRSRGRSNRAPDRKANQARGEARPQESPEVAQTSEREIIVGGYYLWVASGCPMYPCAKDWLLAASKLFRRPARGGAGRASATKRCARSGLLLGRSATLGRQARRHTRSISISP